MTSVDDLRRRLDAVVMDKPIIPLPAITDKDEEDLIKNTLLDQLQQIMQDDSWILRESLQQLSAEDYKQHSYNQLIEELSKMVTTYESE